MNIVTISELANSAPVLTAIDAPVWRNADGVQYRIASGQIDTPDGAWTPESGEPAPSAPSIIAGVDGFTALAIMGLTQVSAES